MERSGSQKFLLVVSIISIVFGVFACLGAILTFMGSAVIGTAESPELTESLAGSGYTQGDVAGMIGILGASLLLYAILDVLVGILGIRAANDNQKIMPVWVLAIIALVLEAIALILVIVGGDFSQNGLTTIFSLLISALMFWVANNIKREAGR